MSESAIVIRGLSKRFGQIEVLHQIDLEIAQGEATCVIGPSGSGKSTLLRCLAFLEEANAGTIEVHGEPLGPEGVCSVGRPVLDQARAWASDRPTISLPWQRDLARAVVQAQRIELRLSLQWKRGE